MLILNGPLGVISTKAALTIGKIGLSPMTEIQIVYNGPIVNRADAKASGSKRYFSGKTCPKLHLAERFTSNGRCVVCAYCQRDNFRISNPNYEAERYVKNKEYILASNRRWVSKNPLKSKIKAMRYSAKKRLAEGFHVYSDIIDILNKQKWMCIGHNCKANFKIVGYEIDHIFPLSKGGSNWPSNLQCLCRSCNARKSNIDPIKWARINGMLI